MKNFNGRPFFFVVFRCAGQSENPDLGARPREYSRVAPFQVVFSVFSMGGLQ
jgi:hypothetical protein